MHLFEGISKAVQWGFMGDVGIVLKSLGGNQHFHMGTVPQRIPSFRKTLDMFLQMPGAVFSSIVPARKDKNAATTSSELGEERGDSIVADMMKIIGNYSIKYTREFISIYQT